MKPLEIKGQLVAKGITLTQIAQTSQVSVALVSKVIRYKRNNHKVRLAIAKALDKPWAEVFNK